MRSTLALAAALIVCASAPSTQSVAVEENAADASSVLAKRSNKWLRSQECALSCHTTVPFVLASDQLGGRTNDVVSAIQTKVEGRVKSWPPDDPWYAMNERKVAESRGTEAVLNAAALVKLESSGADAAIENMFAEQREDGAWDWLDFGLAPFEDHDAEVGGAALAAFAIGSSPSAAHPDAVDRLRGYLRAHSGPDATLHQRLNVLWASEHLSDVLPDAARAEITATLIAAQRSDGAWDSGSFGDFNRPTSSGDAYFTAFSSYVLAQVEDAASRDAARRGRGWLRAHQQRSGAWDGHSLNDGDAFNAQLASDAATAYAVLALSLD